MHRNDLETIPGFLAAGLLFAATDPRVLLAQLGHFIAYANAHSHELRATCFTVGSLIVIVMACSAPWAAL